MSIFSKFFGKKAPASVVQNSQLITPSEHMGTQVPQIDKSLFTEDRHPSDLFSNIGLMDQKRFKKTILEDLKSKDYYGMGMRDGLENPNFEIMDENINLISCEFKEVYSQAIKEIDDHLLKIERTMVPQFEDLMPYEYREITLLKTSLEEQKRALQHQADFVCFGEGYIEKSVELYKAGFKKGFRQWSNENLMFRPFNTL